MNLKQLIVVTIALVALVGLVTFAVTYLPGRGKSGPSPNVKSRTTLTFPVREVPPSRPDALDPNAPPPEPPREIEWHTPGHQDFWFSNDNDEPVPLGLYGSSCKCSQVQVALAPEGWDTARNEQAAQAAARTALGHGGPLGVLTPRAFVAAGPGPDTEWTTLESSQVNRDAKPFVVPPRRGGWVRIGYKGERIAPERLNAELWTHAPNVSEVIRLEVLVVFVEAVRVFPETREKLVETLSAEGPPREASFVFFSSTRDHFSLEPEAPEAQAKNHPFVTVAAPVPLTSDERAKLQPEVAGRVLSGYRVKVTVRERLSDGRIHDMGPYRTPITFTSDAIDGPMVVAVGGVVQGDVTVVSETDVKDRIVMGTFSSRHGKTARATLEGDPALELRVDTHPPFMEVKLDKEEAPAGLDRRTWSLAVTVLPDQVEGPFPRADDVALRDTAVYLKTQQGRRIRIPVSGSASQR
jgi:hypothetical protein